MKRSIANPLRTAAQLAPSAVITEIVDVFFYDMNDRQYAAMASGLLLIFSYAHNLFEQKKGRALFVRTPAP